MRDAMPLPAIPGLLTGHVDTAMSLGTAPRPLALARLVVVLADPDPDESTVVEVRDGVTTLLTATLGAAASEIEVVPSSKTFVYADTALTMVVTAAGDEAGGLSGLLEIVPYG